MTRKHKTPALSRFEADLHRLLTTLLQREVEDPMLQGLSLTRFELLDVRGVGVAHVHSMLSVDQAEVVRRLNHLKPHLLHLLRKALPKKRMPDLEFRWDAALDKTHQVMDKIAGLNH